MVFRFWGLLVVLFAGCGSAQTVDDGERLLRDAVLSKQHVLRDFSAEETAHWHWDGASLVESPPIFRTVGLFTASSVTVEGNRVLIRGDRKTLLKDNQGKFGLSPAKDRASIEVDLTGADLATILPRLADLLFYPSLQNALANLPANIDGLPADADPNSRRKKPIHDIHRCDCAAPSVAVCGMSKPDLDMAGITPPSVRSSAPAILPDHIQRPNENGYVQFILTVDLAGMPTDIWITRAGGTNYESASGKALSQYRYKPATCHGKPLVLGVFVDFNFNP